MTPRILKTSGIVLGAIVAVTVLIFGALLFNFYTETRHPLDSRSCECDLLTQWAASLPLTLQGGQLLQQDVTVEEGPTAFGMAMNGMSPNGFSREVLIEALTERGFNQVEGTITEALWSASFFPGDRFGNNPWRMTVTTADDEIGIRIGVNVDGSPWGLETLEDLHDFYREDLEAALAAQEEREQQAIESLKPLRQALQDMVRRG